MSLNNWDLEQEKEQSVPLHESPRKLEEKYISKDCVIDIDDVKIPESKIETKSFFSDQASLLITGALSFLASFAVNSFVQSIFNLSLPFQSTIGWELVLYNLIYVIVVVAIALAIMLPLAKKKFKRDLAAKNDERKHPTLVKVVGSC